MQRGQHAGAGLGTEPHDPSGGQHDAVRCWLGLGSNDPLRCGSSSAHTTFAMRNLLLLAKNPSGDARCCLASALLGKPTLYLANFVPPPFLWRCHGWVGWGTKRFPGFFCRQGGCTRSQRCSRHLLGRRMSSGSRVRNPWVQTQCRHSLITCRGGSMPVLVRNLAS